MGRLTEIITYINAEPKELASIEFYNFHPTESSKDFRKWIRKGKEETYKEYIFNKEERQKKKIDKTLKL